MGKTEYVGSLVDLAIAGILTCEMADVLLRDEGERELFIELLCGRIKEDDGQSI